MCQTKTERSPDPAKKMKEGVILLFVCAFLFSLMGLCLQYTGRFGIPSNEMVFLRAMFQGVLVVGCMVHFRFDCTDEGNIDEEEAGTMMVLPLHDAGEEKKLDDEHILLQKGYQATYGLADVDKRARTTRIIKDDHRKRIIYRPFGRNQTQIKIVLLRGFIG